MKKKDIVSLRKLSIEKLQSEADKVRAEIAKKRLDLTMGNAKDTNEVSVLKNKLATINTLMREKEILASEKPEKNKRSSKKER